MKNKLLANFALFLTALIWGVSFVAQREGMEHIGPFTFNMVRSFLGALSLLPVILWVKLSKPDTRTKKRKRYQHINLARAGVGCRTCAIYGYEYSTILHAVCYSG